ncbi:27909_t:CDS:2, partial [Dentiscutata erythropus]
MANISTETLAQFYGVLLYKKKDIVAIQEKLGMLALVTIGWVLEGPGNANKLAVPPDSELMGKTLADSKNLSIDSNPILEEALRGNKASTDILFAIQEEVGIVGYSNQERAEEADKPQENIFESLRISMVGPLEDGLGVILPKYCEMGVKKFWFTGEGLPLFPKVTPQQLHEIF